MLYGLTVGCCSAAAGGALWWGLGVEYTLFSLYTHPLLHSNAPPQPVIKALILVQNVSKTKKCQSKVISHILRLSYLHEIVTRSITRSSVKHSLTVCSNNYGRDSVCVVSGTIHSS